MHVRGSYVVEEGQIRIVYVGQKETVLHLTTLSTEQEQKLNAPSLMCIKHTVHTG